MSACVCVCVFDFDSQGIQSVINILKYILQGFEPECAGLLNKSSFIWLDLGAWWIMK